MSSTEPMPPRRVMPGGNLREEDTPARALAAEETSDGLIKMSTKTLWNITRALTGAARGEEERTDPAIAVEREKTKRLMIRVVVGGTVAILVAALITFAALAGKALMFSGGPSGVTIQSPGDQP